MAVSPTSRLASLRTLQTANLDGAFATAFVTLTSGTFLVGYVQMVGGRDEWIGLLGALPSLVGIFQIPGGVFGRRFESYKRFVAPGGLTWRMLYLPLIVLPLLALPTPLALTLLSLCVGLGWACNNFVAPVYNEWLGEVVPATSRGYYFSRRNARMAATGAIVGVIGGLILDAYKRSGYEAIGYSNVFGLGVVCAGISMALFYRMSDLRRPNPERQTVREGLSALKQPFADVQFRKVLLFIAAFVLGQMFAGNFFAAYALERLHMPFTLLQVIALVHAAGNVFSAPIWGFLSDKYGNKPTLILAACGITITPLPWLLCVPGADVRNAAILIVLHVISGASWAGVLLCQFNLVLATAPQKERATYIGAALAVQSIMGGLSPLFGGALMGYLRDVTNAQSAYTVLFVVNSFLRASAVFFLGPVREEGAVRIRRALSELRRVTPRGYFAMRDLTRSSDESKRQTALRSVATEHLTLALDQIVKALHDPSPRVRRQAAAALAELRDPAAVEALLHQLHDHPDLVEEETVEALGEIRDGRAVPRLIDLLQSPRPLLRRAAAKALGRIGGADATRALGEAAWAEGDPDLKRASLQALRLLGASSEDKAIEWALFDPAPSVRIAAAEAIAELNLVGARDFLHTSLEQFPDEASAEVAYALGAIGSVDDVPAILKTAAACQSVITRRRCLLGVARVLHVERAAYRLLLTEEMERDGALSDMLRPQMRRHPRLRAAIERHSEGDEAGALHAIHSSSKDPVLEMFVQQPVAELFVVAVCAVAEARD